MKEVKQPVLQSQWLSNTISYRLPPVLILALTKFCGKQKLVFCQMSILASGFKQFLRYLHRHVVKNQQSSCLNIFLQER